MTDKKHIRNGDDCKGEDCPVFLRQEKSVQSINTGQKIIIVLFVATIAFQGITYRSLVSFINKYNEQTLTETRLDGEYAVAVQRIRGDNQNLSNRYSEHLRQFHGN